MMQSTIKEKDYENEYTKQLSDEELDRLLPYLVGVPALSNGWADFPRDVKLHALITGSMYFLEKTDGNSRV